MKIFENKLVIGFICVIVAALLAFFVLPKAYKDKGKTILICKLQTDVQAGTKIEAGMLREVEVGSFGLPADVITVADELEGKYAKVSLTADDLLLPSKFSDYASDETLDRILAEGLKLISITVPTNASSVANQLEPGDMVSVLYYVDKEAVLLEELRNLEVYSIRNKDAIDIDEARNIEKGDTIAAVITFIANEVQAQKLVAAEYSGNVHIMFEKRGVL